MRRGQSGAMREEPLGEVHKLAERGGGLAFDSRLRQHTGEEGGAVARQGVAEQQPVESAAPRVLGEAGKLEARAVRFVDAPANAAPFDPVAQPREIALREA